MKSSFVLASILLIPITLCAPVRAQEASEATTLSPDDLGMEKYVFESAPPKGFVTVFRREEYRDDRLVQGLERITNTNVKHEDKVVLIDWTRIRSLTSYTLVDSASTINLPDGAFYQASQFQRKPALFKIVFYVSKDGVKTATTFLYTVTYERYSEVKRRLADPPSESNGWTYAHGYTAQEGR